MDLTISEYIEDLKKDKETAERAYKVCLSTWNRAKAAYGKAKWVENAFKVDCDGVSTTLLSSAELNNALLQAAQSGHIVVGNTDKARKAVELLVCEIQDIVCQAEEVGNLLADFKKAVEAVLGKDKPALACIDEVIKTLPDVSVHAFAALDKSLTLIQNVNIVKAGIGGECGVNARLLCLSQQLKICGLKDDLSAVESDLIGKYGCVLPAASSDESKCKNEYAEYLGKPIPTCDRNFESSFAGYNNKTKTGYLRATEKSTAAQVWLNCVTEEKNKAESAFNACKAAYDAAIASKKC